MSESYDAMWEDSYQWDEETGVEIPQAPRTSQEVRDAVFQSVFNTTLDLSPAISWMRDYYYNAGTQWVSWTDAPIATSNYYTTAPASLSGTPAVENDGTVSTWGGVTRTEPIWRGDR